MLVDHYDIIIKVQFFPERWLKMRVIMIEKVKGPVLGKLRKIQLIEADLQITMRIVVNVRNKGNIESDDRVFNINYVSRPRCSIKDAILEKRLVFENGLVIVKHIIYDMTDLKACYDRKLSKIGSIVQETLGVETKPIQLMTKILPIMDHL